MPLVQLSRYAFTFPPPSRALDNPAGLLAMGGDLSLKRLLIAYQSGIFPWFSAGEPILWWSPDPRAILLPERLHISRSMRRFHRHSPYQVTVNQAFGQVIAACAENRAQGTWITPAIITAYQRLHDHGYAHSLEVWQNDTLVGGLYGVAQGAVFCAESMFSRRDNASKTALLVFCQYFARQGGKLIDCQILNPHTASLGAKTIPRSHYLTLLERLRHTTLTTDCWTGKTVFSLSRTRESDRSS